MSDPGGVAEHRSLWRGWVAYLVFPLGVVLLLLAAYSETVWSMVSIWYRSGTYMHAFIIAPISLWLIWEKRHDLSRSMHGSAWWPLVLLIPGGFVWLLAEFSDVLVIQQLAVVGMLVVALWAILGHGNTWLIAFPLAFLFLMVPMGEDLVNPMMEFTAVSTVWLIKHSGVPVYQEGLYFHLPSGSWSVIEACSGVRYLIASFTVGLLYAYISYRSIAKRLVFVLLSILVPVIANTLRAYMIVMLGHHSGMAIATGVDHLVYGWLFFGVVMVFLFWIGTFWCDDNAALRSTIENEPAGQPGERGASIVAVTLCGAILLITFPAIALWMENRETTGNEPSLVAPQAIEGWSQATSDDESWRPRDRGASVTVESLYTSGGKTVNVSLQHFQKQDQGQELVSGRSDQINDKESRWKILRQTKNSYGTNGARQGIWEMELSSGGRNILVWYWYRIAGQNISNRYLAKWVQAVERIRSGNQAAAMIAISTDVAKSSDGVAQARESLSGFMGAYGDDIGFTLDQAAEVGAQW